MLRASLRQGGGQARVYPPERHGPPGRPPGKPRPPHHCRPACRPSPTGRATRSRQGTRAREGKFSASLPPWHRPGGGNRGHTFQERPPLPPPPEKPTRGTRGRRRGGPLHPLALAVYPPGPAPRAPPPPPPPCNVAPEPGGSLGPPRNPDICGEFGESGPNMPVERGSRRSGHPALSELICLAVITLCCGVIWRVICDLY